MQPRPRRQTRRKRTGPQSSTRLLKRPGERPRVAKPQPSEKGLAPRRWRLLQRKQPTSPPSTKPPQRSQKAPRGNVVLTQMRQGRRWRSSRPRQRRQSAMALRVRLRSRRQTTGPQSSTRLLKRPGERPQVAKPQLSEQGLPPRRWRLLQRKQATSPPSTKPPQRSQKAPRSNVVLTQMRQGRR